MKSAYSSTCCIDEGILLLKFKEEKYILLKIFIIKNDI